MELNKILESGAGENSKLLEGIRRLKDIQVTGNGVREVRCLCDKMLKADEHARSRHSGVVNFQECLCNDCRKEFSEFVRVVCIRCKRLQAFLRPQRASTGYVFAANSCVHVERCVSCEPTKTAFPVLEHLRFCRAQGLPTNVDMDIVQEAEQKSLQAVREAGKMRAEMQDAFPTS